MFQTDGKGQKGGTGSDMKSTRYMLSYEGHRLSYEGHVQRSDFHMKVNRLSYKGHRFSCEGNKKTFIRKQRLSNAFHRLSYE